MHIKTFKFQLVGLVSVFVLAGCANQTPYMDKHFGNAVNSAKAQQTIYPEASLNTEPVTGVDGEAANSAVDRYHKSFVQPPATTNVFNIGVGSGGSSTGTGTTGSGNR